MIPIESQIAVNFKEKYVYISHTFEIPEMYDVLTILFAYHRVSFGSN